MPDDNVIKLVTTADGKLCQEKDLPAPGTREWTKQVLRNFFHATSLSDETVELAVLGFDEVVLDKLVFLMVGDLVDLLATPLEEYHAKGKTRMGNDLPEDAVNGEYIGAIIYDLFFYLEREKQTADFVVANLTRGQAYTFLLCVADSINRAYRDVNGPDKPEEV